MKKIDLFPLSIFSFPLGFPDTGNTNIRKEWIERILEMRRDSSPPRSEISAWTGDVKGYGSLHEEPLFMPLFAAIARGLTAYLAEMSVDPSVCDLYVTRSWGVVAQKNERVNRHAHLQSHLSVAYYLQTSGDGGRLAFFMPEAPNEFLPGLFETRMGSLFKGPRNAANSSTTLVDVADGDLIVFPSKTVHATEPHASETSRISISADIVVTLKDAGNHEFGLPSLSHWTKLSE